MDKNDGQNHLKAWREFNKMSQEELAAAAGTTNSVISMLENGNRGLSAKWLRKLAPILRTTPGHLLDLDPHEVPTDIFEIWVKANTTQRRQLIEIAKTLVLNGTEG